MKLYYICTYGIDCDRHTKRSCTPYLFQDTAFRNAKELDDASDGIIHSVVSAEQAEQYCYDNGIDFPDDYYFNDDNELVKIKPEEDPEPEHWKAHATWLERDSDHGED